MPRDSTLVTIFAGGNDVNIITAALGGGAGAGNPAAFIDQQVQNFGADYATLLDGIRDRSAPGPDRRAERAEPRPAAVPRQRAAPGAAGGAAGGGRHDHGDQCAVPRAALG